MNNKELQVLIEAIKKEEIFKRISKSESLKQVDNIIGEFFLLHFESIMKTREILMNSYGDVMNKEDIAEGFLLVFYGCFQGKEMPKLSKRHIRMLKKRGFQRLATSLKEVDGSVQKLDAKEVYVGLLNLIRN